MKTVRTLAVLAALAGGAAAQIDAIDYMPLGSFNAWEMIDRAAWEADGTKTGHQIISVTKTLVVDGVTRYNVRTKLFQDVPSVLFQFGVEPDPNNGNLETLFLYAVRILLPTEFINDPDIKVGLPTVFFDAPVPVGTAVTALNNTVVTPVTAKFFVKIKIGSFLDESGFVFIDNPSTVSVTWLPVADFATPAGPAVGPPLAQLVLDFDFVYSSNNDDINDELEGQETHKSVGGTMGPGIGFVEIDGQGSQQKVVNRAILPGDLVYNPGDLDEFPPLPPLDVNVLTLPLATGVAFISYNTLAEGDIIDGDVTLDNPVIDHDLAGRVVMTAQASAGGAGPVDLTMKGVAKYSPKTGGLKLALKGKTKQLPEFAKAINFSVKQEIPLVALEEGATTVDVVYKAGKDPVTKELITGTLSLPITLFTPDQAEIDVVAPVDVPKIKKAAIFINPANRKLAAEGTLTLTETAPAEGGVTEQSYEITLRESAKLKEGLPTKRVFSINQTGFTKKLFKFAAESDAEFSLAKFIGNIARTKIKPDVTEVAVQTQPD